MALFEFEDGHLVPAQFGYPVSYDLGPELVDAICQQVLQIVSRPLFPVTWRDMTGQDDEETPRLTALDVTGQIVSVEILKELDSETLITSLSRLAEVASISWSDLAAEYPSGPEGFRAGWAQFRDSMPPAVGPGPRLIMVAGDIDPSVRPALSVLATSGVEVHLMNLRQMSNGRLFLDVNAVGPRLYGHAPQLLASATAAPEITAATEQPAPFEESAPAESAIPAPAEEGAEALNEEDSETPTTRPTPKVAPHLREVFTYPIDEEPPAPWKPAAEESSTEDFSDEQPVSETAEHAEHTVHGDDSEDAEAELADVDADLLLGLVDGDGAVVAGAVEPELEQLHPRHEEGGQTHQGHPQGDLMPPPPGDQTVQGESRHRRQQRDDSDAHQSQAGHAQGLGLLPGEHDRHVVAQCRHRDEDSRDRGVDRHQSQVTRCVDARQHDRHAEADHLGHSRPGDEGQHVPQQRRGLQKRRHAAANPPDQAA